MNLNITAVEAIRRSRTILREDLTKVSDTLDMLGFALANHGHTWTPEQRAAFDKAHRILSGTQ